MRLTLLSFKVPGRMGRKVVRLHHQSHHPNIKDFESDEKIERGQRTCRTAKYMTDMTAQHESTCPQAKLTCLHNETAAKSTTSQEST